MSFWAGGMGAGLFRIVVNHQGEVTRLATREQNFRASIKIYLASVPVCSRCRRKKLITKRRREVGLCAGCEKKVHPYTKI